MKETSRQNDQDRPEASPDWPHVSCTQEELRVFRKGIRLWAKVAVRSYMRKYPPGSQNEQENGSAGEEERREN